MLYLHPLVRWLDHTIGGLDNMAGGTVVVGQEERPGAVVFFEAADKFDRRAAEGIDVLIIVAHREKAQLIVFFSKSSAGQRGDQTVLIRTYILVLVHQYPAEACQQARPHFVRLIGRQSFPA